MSWVSIKFAILIKEFIFKRPLLRDALKFNCSNLNDDKEFKAWMLFNNAEISSEEDAFNSKFKSLSRIFCKLIAPFTERIVSKFDW